jgi:ABC-type multidrug transport system fused ATPase/permease subunit
VSPIFSLHFVPVYSHVLLSGLEQSMVALERVEEFSELPQEAPEFIEPRPPASWPQQGAIEVDNLVIRYAVCIGPKILKIVGLTLFLQPQLPNVLHNLNFSIKVNAICRSPR